MVGYFHNVWTTRYFWLALVRSDLYARYRRSVLGIGWTLIHPIVMTAVMCVVFHKLLNVDVGQYAPFVLVGLALWGFVTHVIVQGCHTFYVGTAYIRQHAAPLAIYPLRTTLAGGIHFLLALIIALVATSFAGRTAGDGSAGVLPLLTLIPTLCLLLLTGWSVAILVGLTNVFFRDTEHLSEVALRISFYLTPVMYPPRVLRESGLEWLSTYNPLAAYLDLLRTPILDASFPAPAAVVVAGSTSLLLVAAAALAMSRFESKIVLHL